jgi:hypothetical protein
MLWKVIAVLGVVWFLGMVRSYTMGGLIHLLVAGAIIALLFNLFERRKAIN